MTCAAGRVRRSLAHAAHKGRKEALALLRCLLRLGACGPLDYGAVTSLLHDRQLLLASLHLLNLLVIGASPAFCECAQMVVKLDYFGENRLLDLPLRLLERLLQVLVQLDFELVAVSVGAHQHLAHNLTVDVARLVVDFQICLVLLA